MTIAELIDILTTMDLDHEVGVFDEQEYWRTYDIKGVDFNEGEGAIIKI